MGISNISIPTTTVPVLNGSITVRGLSFEDITRLFNAHKDDVVAVFDMAKRRIEAGGGEVTGEDVMAIVEEAVARFPGLISEAVALAAEAPDQVDLVRRFPAPALIAVATEVVALTFASEVDVERIMGVLTSLLSRAAGALPEAEAGRPSTNGVSDSASKSPGLNVPGSGGPATVQ